MPVRKTRGRVRKTVVEEQTKYAAVHAARIRAELDLGRTLARARDLQSWASRPSLVGDTAKPDEVLRGLETRKRKLVAAIEGFHRQEARMLPKPPVPGDFGPSPEDLRRFVERAKPEMELLERMERLHDGVVLQAAGDDEPRAWSAVIASTESVRFPRLWWTEDDDATYHDEIHFDPWADVTRGILYGRFGVRNPAPFDWPFVEESHDWAQLMTCNALVFDVPPPEWDAVVAYDASFTLGLSPSYSALDYVHYAECLHYLQPNASTGAPVGLESFERVGESIRNVPGLPLRQLIPVTLSRSYFVPRGVRSRIYLGFSWNLSISSGSGGTASRGWDNLVVFRPPGASVWGIRVNAVEAV